MEEQVCHICTDGNKDKVIESNSTVVLICDNCLKSEQLSSLLDQVFLS
ncbi:hypothetical protein [Neobacillus endophyticus]|nr:hypothetical protein [Neobacillus endophyticus]